MKKLDTTILDDIDFIETCIGGYHSKNTYLLMSIALFRHKYSSKATFLLELKLGKINEEKDRIEHVKELLKK